MNWLRLNGCTNIDRLRTILEIKRESGGRLVDIINDQDEKVLGRKSIMMDDDLDVDIVDGRVVLPEFDPSIESIIDGDTISASNFRSSLEHHRYSLIKNQLRQHMKLYPESRIPSPGYDIRIYDKELYHMLLSYGVGVEYRELGKCYFAFIESSKIDDLEFLMKRKDMLDEYIKSHRPGFHYLQMHSTSYSFYLMYRDDVNIQFIDKDLSSPYSILDLYLHKTEAIDKNHIAAIFGYKQMHHSNREITDMYSPKFEKKIILKPESCMLLTYKCILFSDMCDGKQIYLPDLYVFYKWNIPHHVIERNHVLIDAYLLDMYCRNSDFMNYISPLLDNKIITAHLSICDNDNCKVKPMLKLSGTKRAS